MSFSDWAAAGFIALFVIYCLVAWVTLALCKSAAEGDEQLDRIRRIRDKQAEKEDEE